MFGMPAKEKIPKKLLERLQELFKTTDFVEVDFFTHLYVPSSGEAPHGFIAFKVKKQVDQSFNTAIGKIVSETLASSQFIDIVPMSEQTADWMSTPHMRIFYRANS